MEKINKDEMKKIVGGGTNITGSIINAICECIKTIFEIGESFGSAIRRIKSGNLCKF